MLNNINSFIKKKWKQCKTNLKSNQREIKHSVYIGNVNSNSISLTQCPQAHTNFWSFNEPFARVTVVPNKLRHLYYVHSHIKTGLPLPYHLKKSILQGQAQAFPFSQPQNNYHTSSFYLKLLRRGWDRSLVQEHLSTWTQLIWTMKK